MAKIPFDIKYRPQIESGEYKVVTVKEQPVRIICWDRSTTYWKIIALVLAPDGKTENPFTYDVNGNESDGCLHNHDLDLFIITPEPELSEFEVEIEQMMYDWEDLGIGARQIVAKHIKELRRLAREEIIKSGYAIIESEHYLEEGRKNYERGKAEVIKDLPSWKKANGKERFNERLIVLAGNNDLLCTNYAEEGEYYISFSDLEKLPKEDEK